MTEFYTTKDIELFWAKVDRGEPDVCWPWLGTKMAGGYGLFDRRKGGQRICVRSHRLAYTLMRGSIPEGEIIRHECDNPPCCNPFHLKTGLPKDNSNDMIERGRHWTKLRPESIPRGESHWSKRNGVDTMARGEHHAKSKLSWGDVQKIREDAGKTSQRTWAKQFGVTQAAIWHVLHGTHWAKRV